jgi:hypothetical protein
MKLPDNTILLCKHRILDKFNLMYFFHVYINEYIFRKNSIWSLKQFKSDYFSFIIWKVNYAESEVYGVRNAKLYVQENSALSICRHFVSYLGRILVFHCVQSELTEFDYLKFVVWNIFMSVITNKVCH